MRAMTELADFTANWYPALRGKRHFRLTRNGELFATLDWETASGSVVVARSRHDLAVIERPGMSSSSVIVRDDPRGPECGTFVPDWRQGGQLSLRGRPTWTWRPEISTRSRWSFRDADQRPALELEVDSRRVLPGGTLAVAKSAARLPELPLLVALGWYLVVQAVDDGAPLAGTAAAR